MASPNQASRDHMVALNKRHSDMARARIRVSCILHRLQECVAGKVEMTPAQIQAAKLLLDKALSNAPTQVSGPGGEAIPTHLKVTFGS